MSQWLGGLTPWHLWVWWVGDPLVSQNTIMEMVAGEMGDPVTLGLVTHGLIGLVMVGL
jgi:hypothetical protein